MLSAKRPFVNHDVLSLWSDAAEDPQHIEIIRLAQVGLWAESHSVAIEDALAIALTRLPNSQISRFEKALDARKRGKS